MTFKEFKQLDYSDNLPIEKVLSEAMYDGKLSYIDVSISYIQSLERERHLQKSRFAEATTNILQLIDNNWSGEHRKEAIKRAIHTYNLSKLFPIHIYDSQYDYTEKDEQELDAFCKNLYGIDLKNGSYKN